MSTVSRGRPHQAACPKSISSTVFTGFPTSTWLGAGATIYHPSTVCPRLVTIGQPPGPVLDRTMSPAELLVLTGSPTGEETTASPGTFNGKQLPFGGCGARARLEVTGVDQIDPTFLADSITVKAWQESKTHPQVVPP